MFIRHSFPDSVAETDPCFPVMLVEGMPGAVTKGVNFLRSTVKASLRGLIFAAFAVAAMKAAAQDQFKPLMQQAFDLHQRGDFIQALPLLRRAYAMQPDDYFVNLLLGIDSLRTGGTEASIPYLKKASRLRPKEDYPLDYLGEAYARQSLFADAARAYMKAVEVAPGSAEPSMAFVDFALSRFADLSTTLRSTSKGLAAEYRLRARALVEKDAARVGLLQRSADLAPFASGIWSELARAAEDSGDSSKAAEACRQALESDPNDLQAWLVQARIAAQAGDWKAATERLNAVAQRSPQTLALEKEKWPDQLQPPPNVATDAAARFFACIRDRKIPCELEAHTANIAPSILFRQQRWEQVAKLPPPAASDRTRWLQRAIALVHLNDCSAALPALERSVAGTSTELYGMFQLSWCYSQEAGRVGQQVHQSSENEAPLHTMRGDIFLRLQAKPDLAVAEYQQALNLAGNDPSVLERLAEAEFSAGQPDAAHASAERALKIDPQRMGAKRTLAKIAIQDRDYTTALPYLRELTIRNPNDVAGKVELGKACAQTGSLDEAWQNLAPALAQGYPDEKGTLHYLLGNILKKMGRTAEAEKAFAKAAQLSEAFQHKSYRDDDPDAQR